MKEQNNNQFLKNHFLSELKKHFKLNIYEVKIWASLLSRGIASAGELSDISGVPRSRCYDVLESLEKKGFIIMSIGKPIKYLAVNPDAILERVKDNINQEADVLSIQFEGIKETDEFRELELLHKSGVQQVDISSISKSIIGRTSINKHLKKMLSNAKSNLVFATTDEQVERSAKLLRGFAQAFAKKGVKARLYSPYNKAVIKKLQNVEYIECNPSTRFASVDGKEMIFIVSNQSVVPDYEVAIWISSPFFVSAVNILFESSQQKPQ